MTRITIHDDSPVKTTCIYCKKPLPLLKCVTRKIGEDISEIMLNGHKRCAKRLLEIERLANEIEEQDWILTSLRRRYATLRTEEVTDSTKN
jgi:hypothetical protein